MKIAANDSAMAVLGRFNLGVFKQDASTPVFEFGTRGQGEEQFDYPTGVHIDEQGFVYVADTQNRRVRKYTPSGRMEWEVGKVPDRSSSRTLRCRRASSSSRPASPRTPTAGSS